MAKSPAVQHVKCKSPKRQTIEFLERTLSVNGRAIDEGPSKKKWSIHDLRSIKPLTTTQSDFFRAFFEGYQIIAYGSAGTGKSYIGLFLALSELLRDDSKQNRIIIVRSAVPTRDIGFMPGTLDEKIMFYETPYRDIMSDLVGKATTYDDMKAAGLVEFVTTSYVRGVSWNNAIVLIDESQNMTRQEINSIMTRIGKNTRVIALGDMTQTDLNRKKGDDSGMTWFLNVAQSMPEFSLIQFSVHDIVRSNFVKSWITACEETLPAN
jgi:phosphate starvation-inducible protein PhoH